MNKGKIEFSIKPSVDRSNFSQQLSKAECQDEVGKWTLSLIGCRKNRFIFSFSLIER